MGAELDFDEDDVPDNPRFVRVGRSEITSNFFQLYGVLFMTIVKQCLMVFECEKHPDGNDRETLGELPHVACGEGDHNTSLFVTAILVGFVYIHLYFIFVAYASIRVAKASVGKKYNFVYSDYRPETAWWAPVVLLKDLLASLTCVLFPGNGGQQILFMAFITFGYFFVAVNVQPFPLEFENYLEFTANGGIVLQIVYSTQFKK